LENTLMTDLVQLADNPLAGKTGKEETGTRKKGNSLITLLEAHASLSLQLQQQAGEGFEILAITSGSGNGWEFSVGRGGMLHRPRLESPFAARPGRGMPRPALV